MRKILAINRKTGFKKNINIDLESSMSKKELRYFYESKDIYEFRCSCDKSIEMHIAKRHNTWKSEDTIYFATENGRKEDHALSCFYAGESAIYIKGYKENDDGTVDFHVDFKMKKRAISEDEANRILQTNDPNLIEMAIRGSGGRMNRIPFSEFIKKTAIMSWNDYYRKYQGSEISFHNFSNYFFGWSNRVKLGKTSLNDHLNAHSITKTGIVLNKYKKATDFGDKIELRFDGNLNKLKISKDLWNEAKEKRNCKNGPYLIAMARNNETKYKKIINFSIIGITNCGLPCDSSYERVIYEEMIERNILFKKPYQPECTEYEFVADAIIPSSEVLKMGLIIPHYKKEIILEIFGVNGNEKYDKLKARKIEIGKRMNQSEGSEYMFGYIDAADGSLSINDIGFP